MTWILWLLLSFVAPAHAQCNGIFGANQACGSVSGGPPGPVAFTTIATGGAVTPVTNFGWQCDSTDRSTQAQNAINSLSAGGGTLYFPPCPVATFTSSLSGTNLTASSVVGTIVIGSIVSGDGIAPDNGGGGSPTVKTTIVSQTSGTPGGAGVYVISQAAIAGGGQGASQPCYRADSQLTFPVYPNPNPNFTDPGGPSIRLTGQGGGSSLSSSDNGANSNANVSCLDLRFQGMQISHVGWTVNGGSGYTSGTAQQTLTLSGGAGPIATFNNGSLVGGSGGTPGTYTAVPLVKNPDSGTNIGNGAKATIVVGAGGNVTSVTLTKGGDGYQIGDVVGIRGAVTAGVPTNFSIPVATVTNSFTCSTPPTWQVVVSGGVVQPGPQPALAPPASSGAIGVVNQGNCSVVPKNPVTVTSTDGGTGATFNIFWVGGKMIDLGGPLEIDHLSIIDGGSANSTTLIEVTNPTVTIHESNFACSSDPMQDAIDLGGFSSHLRIIPPTTDSPSLGFASKIDHNTFNNCNRSVFARSFNALTIITNNQAVSCAGDRFMEVASDNGNALWPYMAQNYTEACGNLRFNFVFSQISGATLINNFVVDLVSGNSAYTFDYYMQDYSGPSGGTSIVGGDGCAVAAVVGSIPLCQTFGPTNQPIGNIQGWSHFAGAINNAAFGNQGQRVQSTLVYPWIQGTQSTTPGTICPPGTVAIGSGPGSDFIVLGELTANSGGAYESIDNFGSNCSGGEPLMLGTHSNGVGFNAVLNDTVTGTTNSKLAKYNGSGSAQAIITTTSDTTGALGVVATGGGTSGRAAIVSAGITNCQFDGAITVGHYVTISGSAGGDCHDAGSTFPTSGEVLGIILKDLGGNLGQIWLQITGNSGGGSSGACANTATTINCTLSGGTSKFDYNISNSGQWTAPNAINAPNLIITSNSGALFDGSTSNFALGYVSGVPGLYLSTAGFVDFSSTGSYAGTVDTGMKRNAAGVVEINNGTAGTLRDITLRNFTASGSIINTGITADTGHADSTVCQDTTSHQFYSGTGAAGICLGTSSIRFKHDIVALNQGLPEILKLKPVEYKLNSDPNHKLYGFTAEQGETALPELVGKDKDGQPQTFDYMGVVPVLVKAIQQQQAEIEELKRRLK